MYNKNMNFPRKKFIFFVVIICIPTLFSCGKRNYFFDTKKTEINIPIASINRNPVLDMENIDKYDQKSLLPPSIKKGTEHQIVTSIQTRLMQLGFMDEDKPTNYFSESTEEAIKKFERQLGVKEDGICTAEIYNKLFSKNAITYEVKRGYEGNDIKLLQQQLYELGYLLNENSVNGYFGEKTETAVIEMQASNKLSKTGIIDLTTLNFLFSENVVAYTINKKSAKSVIKVYQDKLKELGYYFGACDGEYTEDFRMSVKNYQIHNSQYADGYIGPSTKFSLDSKYAKPFTMYMGQRSQSVKQLQKRLVELNYLEERMATGYFGEFTAQAVALFQQYHGLEITGMVDGITNIAINSEVAIPSPTGPIKFLKQFVMDLESIKRQIEETQKIGNVEDLIKVAMLKLGAKYSWGSRGPSTFDCSGFVFWCLNQVGVNVSYMTTYNWRFCTQFEKVDTFEDLIPGDLIIINGHMGIVSENETVIDASSSNGKVVHRDLDEWWKERFVVGFRIFSNENNNEVEVNE